MLIEIIFTNIWKSLSVGGLIFWSLALNAQDTKIYGKVRDAETGRIVEIANIVLLQPADSSLAAGAVSDFDGVFEFKSAPGDYILRATYIGYDPYFRNIRISGTEWNLGNLRLVPSETALEEVLISGVTSMFESDIDKRVYNVENSIMAEGASASELLNTLPSIQISEEGGITMRGSGNVLIYINGRPTNLTSEETENILAQFPANSIKNIELITNPSARYDAQGVGGIINIILKKDQRVGWNGQVNGSIGTRDKYQGGVTLNHGAEKFNFYTAYNFQSRRIFELSESLRETFVPGVSRFLDQDFDTRNINQNHLVRVGADYYVNPDMTLGVYSRFNRSSRDRIRIYDQRHLDPNMVLDSLFNRVLTEDQFSRNLEVGTTFDFNIDSLGQKLYASVSYATNKQVRTEFFDQRFFDNEGEEVPMKRQDQIYGRPIESDLYIAQLDYTRPLGSGLLEAGLKSTISIYNTGQTFDQLNLITNQYEENDTIANRFDFREEVFGGYAIYRNNTGSLGYQLGLRAEQTNTTGFDHNSSTEYRNDYFNLFPSLYLTYETGAESEFLVNYSRRINRPYWEQMAPFYNAQDLLNTRYGNPTLNPEFTDSYEIGYNKGWEKVLITSTVYHRRTTDAMTRIISYLENNSAVQLWDNANWRRDTGLEIINQFDFASNLDLSLTGNFFYSEVNGENIRENFTNSNFTWTLTLLSNWVVPNVAVFQLFADYRGPIIMPQGQLDPIWGINIGVRKDFFNKRATVSLNISDLFNTRIYRIETTDLEFSQRRLFNMETQIGTLTLTYRFGGFRAKEEKPEMRYSDDPF